MADLTYLFDACSEWATSTDQKVGSGGIYLFGSTIKRGGVQFDKVRSDIDLVVLFPTSASTAPLRTEWLEQLVKAKHELELALIPVLERKNAGDPIVSVIAATEHEVRADVHKSAVRDFFSVNIFKNLLDSTAADAPLLGATPKEIPENVRQVIQNAQGFRNKFLGVSASNEKAIKPWEDLDALPKDVMRLATLARPGRESQSRNLDVQDGLDEITNHVFNLRDTHKFYSELHNWISVRRGARGEKTPLSPANHILLWEILFDLCGLNDLIAPPDLRRTAKSSAFSSVTETARIQTCFAVRTNGRLAGRADQIRASIEESTHNAKWLLHPYFEVTMQELDEIQTQLDSVRDDETPRARMCRAKLTGRKLELELVAPLIKLGLEHLIRYQYCLLPPRLFSNHLTTLIKVMNLFIGRCYNWRAKGGVLEAWTQWDDLKYKVDFTLMRDELDSYLTEQFGEPNPLLLAADNRPLATLHPKLIAERFVPELVLTFVAREIHHNLSFDSDEEKQFLLTTQNWQLGLK